MFDGCYIISEIKNYFQFIMKRRLAVWGMGDVGSEFLWELKQHKSSEDFAVETFDTFKDEYKNPMELRGLSKDYYVIVTFLKGYESAEKQLLEYGYKEINDFISLGRFTDIANHVVLPEYVKKHKKLWFPKKQTQNDRLLIIGNGPSFKEAFQRQKKVFLSNDCMCVNFVAGSKFFSEIRPKYYVMSDSAIYTNPEEQSEILRRSISNGIEDIVKNTQWDMFLFLPWIAHECDSLVKKLCRNKFINIVYMYSFGFPAQHIGKEDKKYLKYKLYDERYAMPFLINVLHMALFAGIHLQYREIDLFGAEHSWFTSMKHDEKGILFDYSHSYESQNDMKYLYADNHGDKLATTYEAFWWYGTTFKVYEELQDYAVYRNVKIYNLTPNSFIDAFPRKTIETLN